MKTDSEKKDYMEKAELLKALANPVRLCILRTLVNQGSKNVTELHSCLEVSQSSVSQHLSTLRQSGLVSADKVGNLVYYSCENELIKNIIEDLF